jgi:histidinol-phosphate aminotransferase
VNALSPSHITGIAAYQPGKPLSELERELGAAWPEGGAIKLASNENPLGASPRAVEAAQKVLAECHLYPDGAGFQLCEALAARLEVHFDQIVLGAGSNEIIDVLVRTFCDEGEGVLAPACAFLCYRLAAETHRRPYAEAANGPRFAVDPDSLLSQVTPSTKLVFLANPNNPTGAGLGREALWRLARELPPHVIFAVDEAYLEYARTPERRDAADAIGLLAERERVVVIRTFSKIHGLAGLRVGFAVGPKAIISLMHRVRLPFNVSAVGQAAALASLADEAHLERSRALNARERPRLSKGLAALGCDVFPSAGNFVLCEVPAGKDAASVYDGLLRRGVIVRPLVPYRLGRHLRMTVGTEAQNDRLLGSLAEVLT